MPILDITNKEQMKKYNHFIKSKENTSITQDIGFLSADKNNKFEIVYVEKNEIMTAAMAVIVIPVGRKHSILYSYRGPVMDVHNFKDIDELVHELQPVVDSNKAICTVLDPEITENEVLINTLKNKKYKILKKLPFAIIKDVPNTSCIIDLADETEESILQGVSAKTRYNIEASFKKDLILKAGATKREFEKFQELYKNEIGITIQDIKKFETFKNLLKTFDQETVRIYNVNLQGKTIASAIVSKYENKINCLEEVVADTPLSVFARSRIHFEAIKWGLKSGCKFYDMGVLNSTDKLDKNERFKDGFMNKVKTVEYIGKICKINNKLFYYLYKIRGGK